MPDGTGGPSREAPCLRRTAGTGSWVAFASWLHFSVRNADAPRLRERERARPQKAALARGPSVRPLSHRSRTEGGRPARGPPGRRFGASGAGGQRARRYYRFDELGEAPGSRRRVLGAHLGGRVNPPFHNRSRSGFFARRVGSSRRPGTGESGKPRPSAPRRSRSSSDHGAANPGAPDKGSDANVTPGTKPPDRSRDASSRNASSGGGTSGKSWRTNRIGWLWPHQGHTRSEASGNRRFPGPLDERRSGPFITSRAPEGEAGSERAGGAVARRSSPWSPSGQLRAEGVLQPHADRCAFYWVPPPTPPSDLTEGETQFGQALAADRPPIRRGGPPPANLMTFGA